MLIAARAQGIPMIVSAMITAARPQPTAAPRPPRISQRRFNSAERIDIRVTCASMECIAIGPLVRGGVPVSLAVQLLSLGEEAPRHRQQSAQRTSEVILIRASART